jgi:DNA modification methylase
MVDIMKKTNKNKRSPAVHQSDLTGSGITPDKFFDFNEISGISDLVNPASVFKELNSMDWDFKDSDTSFLTHDIHQYPAKFIPQIPAQLISRLSLRGDIVLDPFGGSGTTAFEAIRLGRRALSIDANPIATLIAKVKTSKVGKSEISELRKLEKNLVSWMNEKPHDDNNLIKKYQKYIPNIPNREKWFPNSSCGELAQIKFFIEKISSESSKNIALLALSKIIVTVSYQDSETRYASSNNKSIPFGKTTKTYIEALNYIIRKVLQSESILHYGIAEFISTDSRSITPDLIKTNSIDLVVTSPPYGNAYDYHLYHRFRLLWLGFDPKLLEKIEVGSHLRHQKEKTGFDFYLSEMQQTLGNLFRVLKPGRYAAIIVGDALYSGDTYNTAEYLAKTAEEIGFETVGIIQRHIHDTKRSVVYAGRRAKFERLLILRKPQKKCLVTLAPPPYKLKEYERLLRLREIELLVKPNNKSVEGPLSLDPLVASEARKLTFTHGIEYNDGISESTWQAKLENGLAKSESSRKEPKYVTHGLHPYKGKFYPQLAKALINISMIEKGSTVLDPFCGSGTTLLECYLNGFRSVGCDMNPLAATIASVKIKILDINPDLLSDCVNNLLDAIDSAPIDVPSGRDQFKAGSVEEIENWFSIKVINKINWLLKIIRGINTGIVKDFFEIILSSIIREISNQEPRDLRIRRRKEPLSDADVFGLFKAALLIQFDRIQKFWEIRGYSPNKFYRGNVEPGDSRSLQSFNELGLKAGSVDLILTSPPYATALPYIDTDRLSLLILFGLNSTERRPLEQDLIGSREITNKQRMKIEKLIDSDDLINMPKKVSDFLIGLQERMKISNVGFRRRNGPSLLSRFFTDMHKVLTNCHYLLKSEAEIMIVIGDNTTSINDEIILIPTADFIEAIANSIGFSTIERIPITVTTESMIHMKNAITENVVLRMKK